MDSSNEILNRFIKYLVEGLAIAAIAIWIPKKTSLQMNEVAMLGISAATIFALLDLVSPSISFTARQGAGFGIGANLVGFPGAKF